MIDTMRLYFKYVGISIRSQVQYRASFLMFVLGSFFTTLSEYAAIWVLFERFGSLRGWLLAEVALFYGLVNVAFAVSECAFRGFDMFSNMVKSGDFDRVLLRPRSTIFQLAAQEFYLGKLGQLTQGLIILLWAAHALDVTWSPLKISFTLAAIGGGVCLFCGLFVLQATMCFWTVESLEIMNTVTYGGVETAQYPLPIYRTWFRRFFTWIIPLACINYFPALVILDKPSAVPLFLQWLSPLIGLGFLVVSLQVWKFGVRHYCSTGS